MSETYAIIRFTSGSSQTLKRIHFYLNGGTRPDFEDEVTEEERGVFKTMEFAETPFEIKQRGKNTLDAYFEFVDESEMEDIIRGLAFFKPTAAYLHFSDDEEYKVYIQYHKDRFIELYRYMDDEALDEKLWGLDWDHRAFDLIIERFGK